MEKRLDGTMIRMLERPFVTEEIQKAVKQMHPTKAPGPDGMPPLFYQHYWNTIHNDITSFVLDILNNGRTVEDINHTHIVLTPKKKFCELPSDFRPISLCNVLYKIILKVLANRLK